MPNRALNSGQHVTAEVASLIKAMVRRGDRSHDVAAFFGLNPGRVAEVVKGRLFPSVEAARGANLPPPGPYLDSLFQWQKTRCGGARALR